MISLRFTHWGRVTHIWVRKVIIIGSYNGLSPGRRQAIIWTNAGILLIRPLGTNFNEMLIEILTFSFTKMRLKVSSAKWRPFCLGLNVLISFCGVRVGAVFFLCFFLFGMLIHVNTVQMSLQWLLPCYIFQRIVYIAKMAPSPKINLVSFGNSLHCPKFHFFKLDS